MLISTANLLHFLRLADLHHHDPSASLHGFRTKTSNLMMLKPPENGPELMSAAWSENCFEMLRAARRAFAELVTETDYPMSKWGGAATHEYLDYTLILLDLLNSINSSVSRLRLLKFYSLHGETPPISAARFVRADFEVKTSLGIETKPASDRKERVILEALVVLKKIEFFALSLVVDSLSCVDVPAGEFEEVVWEIMEKTILGIKKKADRMFFEVMATRNELLDNIRF